MVNARSLLDFFHSSHNFSLIFLFSLLVGEGGDIIHRYHRDIWRARTQARSGLAFPIHTLSLNKYITKKKCELTFGLYRRYALQAFGDSCMSLSNVCNAGWTLYMTIEPFLVQMFDTIRKDKMSKIYTLHKLLFVEKFKSMARTCWY